MAKVIIEILDAESDSVKIDVKMTPAIDENSPNNLTTAQVIGVEMIELIYRAGQRNYEVPNDQAK